MYLILSLTEAWNSLLRNVFIYAKCIYNHKPSYQVVRPAEEVQTLRGHTTMLPYTVPILFKTVNIWVLYSSSKAQQPNWGLGRLNVYISRSHTHARTHTPQDSSEHVISSSQRPLPTQHIINTETNIHSLGGIRTRNSNNRAAADLHLRPHGHRDRLSTILIT